MYKLINETTVQSLSNNAFIPFDTDNTDYQAYLKWLELGNVPQEADNAI